MITVMLYALLAWLVLARAWAPYLPLFTMVTIGAVLAIDRAARDLVADVRLAMKRADLSVDFVSRCTGVPPSRLSDQLNGKTPFTAFWRFGTAEMRETDFWVEFLELQAERVDRMLVSRDLGTLVAKVEAMVGLSTEKASLVTQEEKLF